MFNYYTKQNDLVNLRWRMDPVTNPNLMRIEHVPMHLREEAIKNLEPLVGTLQDAHLNEESHDMVRVLMKTLTSTEKPTEGSYEELLEYTKVLDIKRKQDVLKIFPHLKEVFNG